MFMMSNLTEFIQSNQPETLPTIIEVSPFWFVVLLLLAIVGFVIVASMIFMGINDNEPIDYIESGNLHE